MNALTHVCRWSGNDWQRITAEEAAQLHPGGTVSAHSGLFMCELCGQYVTLTRGGVRRPYFKHNAHEKSKDCSERTRYLVSDSPQEYDLPIRITGISSSAFRFEVGLIPASVSSLSRDFRIEIKPKGDSDVSYVFTKERLNCGRITYLSIGERPFEQYTLNVQDPLCTFWPTEIKGMDPKGTLFEKGSGKKLPYDSDVEIEKEYYLLKQGDITKPMGHSIQIQEIARQQFYWETWRLYVVSASVLDEEAARFYLDFHCRLTHRSVSLQPVWPLFIGKDNVIKHNQDSMYILVEGNISEIKTIPSAAVHQLNDKASQPALYEVLCSDRQQRISVGRTQTLKYIFFWKEPLDQVGVYPNISVTDLTGFEVSSGEATALPPNKTLHFKSTFDGEIILSNNHHIIHRRTMPSNKKVVLDGLSFGWRVQVMVGLDLIWQIDFKKQQSSMTDDEVEMLKRLTNVSGNTIPIPHSLRNILVGMNGYPKVCQWIQKCIKHGTIYEQSYRRLQETYLSMNTDR